MSGMENGDESQSLDDFAASVIADIEGMDDGDTATAPPESTDTNSTTDGTDTAEAPDPTADATGRLHGEDGKFVAKPKEDEVEETTDEEVTPEGEETEPEFVFEVDDEETAEKIGRYLEKYDGDVVKALAAATEAQSLIGRKGTAEENADLRAQIAALQEGQNRIEARVSTPQTPLVPITRDLIENDPQQAAEQAVLQDNAAALEATIAFWREENPDAANLFLQNVVLKAQFDEERRTAAVEATETTSNTDDVEVDAEVAKVLEKHPDLEQHLPAIGKAADANPLLQRALQHGTPQEKAQALEALTVIAKAGLTADTSRAALKRVQIRVKQEADDERRKARVVTASRSSAAPASQPTRVDEFLSAFDARFGLDVDGE